jgi:hypothetical protein
VQNCTNGIYSLRRINPSKNLFYESTEKAQESEANKGKKKIFDKTLRLLPAPISSFDPSPAAGYIGLEWFKLFAPQQG